MDGVTVSIGDLLIILEENLDNHRSIFEKAQEGYRKKAIELLDKALQDAREGRNITTYIRLDAPVDQTKDYERVIRMLKMSVEDEIELTEHDFAQYVLDDWSWKHDFITKNSMYTKVI